MNVTEQINRQMVSYGGGSSNPSYYSSSKSLNYAKGSNSLINASEERVTAVPFVKSFVDSVGLFGAENIFIKIQLDIQNSLNVANGILLDGIVIDGYTEAVLNDAIDDSDLYWDAAIRDYNLDLNTVNTFVPAFISNEIDFVPNGVVKIDLENLKTGNKYIDAWFDVRLYTPDRQPYDYDTMYVPLKGFFYLGFHARNTKRLPYNVRMTVNGELISSNTLSANERKYLIS